MIFVRVCHNSTEIKSNAIDSVFGDNKLLSRQGVPFNGSGDDSDLHLLQLIKLREIDYPMLSNWMAKKINTHTSPVIQNEF